MSAQGFEEPMGWNGLAGGRGLDKKLEVAQNTVSLNTQHSTKHP